MKESRLGGLHAKVTHYAQCHVARQSTMEDNAFEYLTRKTVALREIMNYLLLSLCYRHLRGFEKSPSVPYGQGDGPDAK